MIHKNGFMCVTHNLTEIFFLKFLESVLVYRCVLRIQVREDIEDSTCNCGKHNSSHRKITKRKRRLRERGIGKNKQVVM